MDWSKAWPLDRVAEFKAALEKFDDNGVTARQPVQLGYAAAVFFASGSLNTLQIGTSQRIDISFGKDAKSSRDSKTATVDVTFSGYHSSVGRYGDGFEIKLTRQPGMIWAVQEVARRTCTRRPTTATKPKSGKFSDFLKLMLDEAEKHGPVPIAHDSISKPLELDLYGSDTVDPIDPLIVRVSVNEVSVDKIVLKEAELIPRLKEYVMQVELVNEIPQVIIATTPASSFERGIAILQKISTAGLKKVHLAKPQPSTQRGPHGSPSKIKPTPPKELFPKK